MQKTGLLAKWSLGLMVLGMGGWLLFILPEGAAQGQAQRELRILDREWVGDGKPFARDIPRPGYLPTLAFDNVGNLYVADVGNLSIVGDGGIQKVDAQTGKVSDFADATDVAAVAFDAQGRMAYATGIANMMSEIFLMKRPDSGGIGDRLVRGEILLRMMPQTLIPEIAWALAFGKPDEKGEQPLYVGTSAVGLVSNAFDTEGRILRVNLSGTEVRGIAMPFDVADMAMAPDGSLLFADNFVNTISRVVPDGQGTVTHYATLWSVPTDMLILKRVAMDASGNLYVIARESQVKTNIYKVTAPTSNAPPRVSLFAENLPQTMLPVIENDPTGNLYLVDNTDSGLTVYRLIRGVQ